MVNRFGHPIRLHSLCARLPQAGGGGVGEEDFEGGSFLELYKGGNW